MVVLNGLTRTVFTENKIFHVLWRPAVNVRYSHAYPYSLFRDTFGSEVKN